MLLLYIAWSGHQAFLFFLFWPVSRSSTALAFSSFFFKEPNRAQEQQRPALSSPRDRYNMRDGEEEFVLHNIYAGRWSRRVKTRWQGERKKVFFFLYALLYTLTSATHTRHLAAAASAVVVAASPAVQTGPASSRSSAEFQPAKSSDWLPAATSFHMSKSGDVFFILRSFL